MEIWEQNYLSRSGSHILAEGVTTTSKDIFKRDPRNQFVSSGFANDLTTSVLRIRLNADASASYTGTVSRIAIMNHNLKEFIVSTSADKSSTTGHLVLTSTCHTTSAYWTSNSMASHYLAFASLAATDIYIHMTKTMVADSEKAIGYLSISHVLLDFPRTPGAQGYRINRDQVSVSHILSDGGRRIHILDEKIRAQISFDYITESFRDDLKDVYDSHDQLMFVPFPPTSAGVWDEICFPCQWHGVFNFFKFSDNAINSGHTGSIDLQETPL